MNAGPFGLCPLAVQFGHVERSHLQRAGVRVAAEKEPPEPFNITDTRLPHPSSIFRCRIGSKSHFLKSFDLGPCLHMLLLFLASSALLQSLAELRKQPLLLIIFISSNRVLPRHARQQFLRPNSRDAEVQGRQRPKNCPKARPRQLAGRVLTSHSSL